MTQPYDLRTALLGKVGKAGDTFWLKGGLYQLGHVDTTIAGASGAPITFRQMPGERARVDGSITFFDSPGYITLWGFELFSSDANRVSKLSGAGLTPSDLNLRAGLFVFVPNMKFINLIIHDHVRHGIYASAEASNMLLHGCVFYNNGWTSVDNADGHNVYLHNSAGTKVVSDNITMNGTANNFQIYTDANNASLVGITMEGNVAFNGGVLTTTRRFRDFLIGVDAPAVRADGITFNNNMSYYKPGSRTLPQIQIGREGVNGTLVMKDNYLPAGLLMNNWKTATFTGNLVAPVTTDYIVNLQQTLTGLSGTWNNNVYFRPSVGNDFRRNSTTYGFSAWKSGTGFDANSTYALGAVPGTDVFVRPNKYESGRANIVVYNWSGLSAVDVNVSSVLPIGTQFEVRNAQDFYAAPVLTGTYNGQALHLPMSGLTVAKPNGALVAAQPTGPQFNVFVLLPVSGTSTEPPPTPTPTPTNTAPTISSVANQTLPLNSSTGLLPVKVGDAETAAGSLVLTAASSNTTLVPNSNIVLGGSGTDRTVKVTPALNKTGTATITLTVSDGQATKTTSFTVTVANTPPAISSIPNTTIRKGTSTGPIPFTIGDAETAAGSLTVTARSSNTTLMPNGSIVLGGSGSSRTIDLRPRKNRTGQATITVTVSDGNLSATTSFVLTVTR